MTAGQTLAELAETSLPQNVILAKAELVNAQRTLDNLMNSNANQAQAQLNLANAQQAYNNALWNRQISNTTRVVPTRIRWMLPVPPLPWHTIKWIKPRILMTALQKVLILTR